MRTGAPSLTVGTAWGRAVGVAAGAAASVAVAAAWIPFRAPQRTVVAALILVTVAGALGVAARRSVVIGAALGASLGFTFFDTQPYESFAIARSPDLATAAALLVVGLLTGEVTVRFVTARRFGSSTSLALRSVRGAAALVASGEELVVVLGAVAEQLEAVAGLEACTYSSEPLSPSMPLVGRSGEVGPGAVGQLALPVWALGEVVGHFLLTPAPGALPSRAALQVAGILADQAGAAIAVHALPPPPPPGDRLSGPAPLLRVVAAGQQPHGPRPGDPRPGDPQPAARPGSVPAPGTSAANS